MTNMERADLYVRHISPSRYWIEGARRQWRMLTDVRGDLAEAGWRVVALVVVLGVGWLVSMGLEIVWHPLFHVIPMVAATLVAWMAGFGVYRHAADIDRELSEAAESELREAVLTDGDGILADDVTRRRCEEVFGDRRTSAAAPRREMIMRIAAIRAAVLDGEDMATARSAAAAVVDRAEALTGGIDEAAAGGGRTSSDGRRPGDRMAALAGVAVVTADPTVDALVRMAELALADEPDLVDDAGARIDALVRRHVPTLVASYRRAVRNADATERASAETQYAQGIDLVRRSVVQALDASQARHAQALSQQVRFLDMRSRG